MSCSIRWEIPLSLLSAPGLSLYLELKFELNEALSLFYLTKLLLDSLSLIWRGMFSFSSWTLLYY